MTRAVLLVATLAIAGTAVLRAQTDSLIPIGTTRGERHNRLVIRGATIVSGRGTPGSNRAMPPEGPVDIIIEGNTIVDMAPMSGVITGGRQVQRATGDRVIDATGMFVVPGLVEMHAHLPGNGGSLGRQALEYTDRKSVV